MAVAASRQMSIDDLREQISVRLRSHAAFSKKVYQDQPIFVSGAQLKNHLPEELREARARARSLRAARKSSVEVFYEQAKLLEDYEDDMPYGGEFTCYFPTYEDMSDEQLRGYFSWRTRVRQGCVEQTSLSFAYVYLYELINLIGVDSAEEGYERLEWFGTAYRSYDAKFGSFFDTWLDDFVVYYGLDPALLQHVAHQEKDAAVLTLENCKTASVQELFTAMVCLSESSIQDSPFFREHEQECMAVCCAAYQAAHVHHAKLKTPLLTKVLGRMRITTYPLFDRACFADPRNVKEANYPLSPVDIIQCSYGRWSRVSYAELASPCIWLADLLETCEWALREAYLYPNNLTCKINTKYLLKTIKATAQQWSDEAKQRQARAVHINFAELATIRAQASETCEKLIVEEEEESIVYEGRSCAHASDERPPFVHTPNEPRPAAHTPKANTSSLLAAEDEEIQPAKPPVVREVETELPAEYTASSLLSVEERALIVHLLEGGSAREFEQDHACLASVLIDSINEALYDEFADICIDTFDEPAVIEDYVTDLRLLVGCA